LPPPSAPPCYLLCPQIWEKEADVTLKAKAEGRIVALYKVVGQRRVLIVIDVESHDEIDQALMAVMPLAHTL